jgi:hypothetical protein
LHCLVGADLSHGRARACCVHISFNLFKTFMSTILIVHTMAKSSS